MPKTVLAFPINWPQADDGAPKQPAPTKKAAPPAPKPMTTTAKRAPAPTPATNPKFNINGVKLEIVAGSKPREKTIFAGRSKYDPLFTLLKKDGDGIKTPVGSGKPICTALRQWLKAKKLAGYSAFESHGSYEMVFWRSHPSEAGQGANK